VLDGDMVVTAAPEWFDVWKQGTDRLRVTQEDRFPLEALCELSSSTTEPALFRPHQHLGFAASLK
jgi:hypothetical protein